MSFFGLQTNTVAGRIGTSGGRSPASGVMPKQRLFAHPTRPASYAAGGKRQVANETAQGTFLSGSTRPSVVNQLANSRLINWIKSHAFRGVPGRSSLVNSLIAQVNKTGRLPPGVPGSASAPPGSGVPASSRGGSALGVPATSSGVGGSSGGISRPGGSGSAGAGTTAPADTGAGVISAFQAYEAEINMPRTATADSGFVSLKSAGWAAPFQWWWQSFASKYAAEGTSHAPTGAAATPTPGGGATSSPGAAPAGKTRGLQPQVLAALAWARSHGWHGTVISGFRTFAQQQAIYNSGVRPAAVPGTSMHEKGLAVDVTDPSGFERALANAPASAKLLSGASFGDPNHFSTTGH